jgi:SAM-dependent methyltransferase
MTSAPGGDGPADPYAPLAPIYDEWQARLGSFWAMVLPRLEQEIARAAEDAPVSFLDLGCGTGALLCGLRARHPGWRLCGLDASAAMLAVARGKDGAGTIDWIHAPCEAAPAGGAFTAAGCFYDGLNHLRDHAALARALRAAAGALAPGGLLAFDLNNRLGFETWWQGRQSFAGAGWAMTVDTSFDAASGLGRGRARLVPSEGAAVETEIVERCHPPEEVAAALVEAGFVLERAEPWAFAPGVVAGKTWYVARRAR